MGLVIGFALCALVALGTSVLDKNLSGNAHDLLTAIGWVFVILEFVAITAMSGRRR